MGAKKGTNNFKSFQQNRIQAKLDAIDEFISSLPKRMKFDRFEDLLADCCEYLGCHRTTITRQQVYVEKLKDEFQKKASRCASGGGLTSFPLYFPYEACFTFLGLEITMRSCTVVLAPEVGPYLNIGLITLRFYSQRCKSLYLAYPYPP